MTTGTVVSLVVGSAVSLLIGLMGVYMLITGKAGLLHDYHRETTDPNDLPRLARYSGMGLTILGVGIALITVYTAAFRSTILMDRSSPKRLCQSTRDYHAQNMHSPPLEVFVNSQLGGGPNHV
jgi:hypothetical protein